MNWIDVLLIIIMIIGVIISIFALFCYIQDAEYLAGIGVMLFILFFSAIPMLFFFVLDRGSGSTIGTITSVDKNFFGTTALYIKTSETEQEKYCIEFNKELEGQAKELIGKQVKVSYGERVGLYSTGKCHQAPIKSIELFESEVK